MASDRQQFNRAKAKWDQLHREQLFSLPPALGRTAIISSAFTDDEPSTPEGYNELTLFRAEAHAIAERVHVAGGRPELAIDATQGDIDRLVQDPEVANMYVIGNGCLSSLLLDIKVYCDWYAIAEATTHLKLGKFVQRQCGNFSRTMNVPLGLFAVADPRNVEAALGDSFYPKSLDDPENAKIQSVFQNQAINYDAIKALPASLNGHVS